MTTKINEITAAMLQNVMGMQNMSTSGNVKTDESSMFSDVLDMATVKVNSSAKTDMPDISAGNNDKAENARQSMEKSAKQIKSSNGKKDPVNNEDDRTAFAKDVADRAEKIRQAVKEELGVSDEQIEEAMNNLGITTANLLDPQAVQQLCMQLNGIEDSISLLTDASLYDSVKALCTMASEATQDILDGYEITADQALQMLGDSDFISEVNAALQAEDALTNAQDGSNVSDLAASENGSATAEQMADESKVKVEVTYDKDNEAQTLTGGAEAAKSAADSKTETFKRAASSEEAKLNGREEGFEKVSRFSENESVSPENVVTTTVTETSVNSVGDIVETVSNYTTGDRGEILNQVTESIKVNYSADTTSMELQLHPASLGTVNMHISSQNGIVTAHIIVENETVKAALENQLITLQETFEAQGQKVEAVEVSIAGYDLNHGMNSETGNNPEKGKEEAFARVGGRRRINLNDLSEDDYDEMSEEEAIAADMMARSGNSVDFMA